jgi:hypothetical protein
MVRPKRGRVSFPSIGHDLVAMLRRYALERQSAPDVTNKSLAAIALADTIAFHTCREVRSGVAQSRKGPALAEWIEGGEHPGGFSFSDACRSFNIDCDSLRIALRICLKMPQGRGVEIYLPGLPAALRNAGPLSRRTGRGSARQARGRRRA